MVSTGFFCMAVLPEANPQGPGISRFSFSFLPCSSLFMRTVLFSADLLLSFPSHSTCSAFALLSVSCPPFHSVFFVSPIFSSSVFASSFLNRVSLASILFWSPRACLPCYYAWIPRGVVKVPRSINQLYLQG